MKNRITILALALLLVIGCRDETPTQPQSTLVYYVAPNATVFPESVSTTGIPYIRVRMPGEDARAGSLLDMNEAGWAVGSRGGEGRRLAVAVNVRTGHTDTLIGVDGDDTPYSFQAKAINARGEVVGGAETIQPMSPTAFYWRDGRPTRLGLGSAMGINDNGVVVGYGQALPLAMRPWVWRGGDLQFLGEGLGRAYGINNRGDIVGTASYSRVWKPTIWRGGVRDSISPDSGEATGINERGEIVGWAIHSGVQEAFVWRKGVRTWLGTLQAGQPSQATAINDRGAIVGNVVMPSETHAVLWRDGRIIDLGLSGRTVPFENISEAFGITNSGQVIGRVGQGGNRNGVIWTPPPR